MPTPDHARSETSLRDAAPRMRDVCVTPIDEEIVALEEAMRAAQLAADIDALDRLISAQLCFTGPDGQLATKEDDLAAHRSGLVRFVRHHPQELRIQRVREDEAHVELRASLQVLVDGGLVQGTYQYTRIWSRERDGRWRVVGGAVSEVPGGDGVSIE